MSAAIPLRHYQLHVNELERMVLAGVIDPSLRCELIDGKIFEMAPIGAPHASLVNRLNRIFARAVGSQQLLSVQNPLQIDDHTLLQPDMAVLLDLHDSYARVAPRATDALLVIEVAQSSFADDKTFKVPRYLAAGVPEVWLVSVQRRSITRFTSTDPVGQEFRADAILEFGAVPELRVSLTELFRGM